jgi:hypothetical protein
MDMPKHLSVYRSLLSLFPREFRKIRGPEMERLFLDMSAEWKEALGEWLSLVDLDETAPQWDLEFLSIAYRDFDTWRAEK